MKLMRMLFYNVTGESWLNKRGTMKLLSVLIVLLMLSGCAGMNLSEPERWVEGTTLYSTKMPSLVITVDPSFYYKDAPNQNSIVESNIEGLRSGISVEWFYFKTKFKKNRLNIKVENLNQSGRVYFVLPDFSDVETRYSLNSQTVDGVKMQTAIFSTTYPNGVHALVKAYAKLVGDTTRYQIFYFEKLEKSWTEKYPNYLTQKDRDELVAFSKRADDSFSLSKYAGSPPPSAKATDSNSHDKEILTSYVVTRLKNNNIEHELLAEFPELGRCYSLLPTSTKRDLSSIKDTLVDEISNGMNDTMSRKQEEAFKSSVVQGTILEFVDKHSDDFAMEYLPAKYKNECLDFKAVYSDM